MSHISRLHRVSHPAYLRGSPTDIIYCSEKSEWAYILCLEYNQFYKKSPNSTTPKWSVNKVNRWLPKLDALETTFRGTWKGKECQFRVCPEGKFVEVKHQIVLDAPDAVFLQDRSNGTFCATCWYGVLYEDILDIPNEHRALFKGENVYDIPTEKLRGNAWWECETIIRNQTIDMWYANCGTCSYWLAYQKLVT
jgi:hypothetical protein